MLSLISQNSWHHSSLTGSGLSVAKIPEKLWMTGYQQQGHSEHSTDTIQSYCRLKLTYDSGFLTTVMNNKDIKQFVLDNMSEVKLHIGLEHIKERLGNNNIKYI